MITFKAGESSDFTDSDFSNNSRLYHIIIPNF